MSQRTWGRMLDRQMEEYSVDYDEALIQEMYDRIYDELSARFTNLPEDIIHKCVSEAKENYIENYVSLFSNFNRTRKTLRIQESESNFRDYAFECVQKLQQTVTDVMLAILLSRERGPLTEEVQEFCQELGQLPSRPLEYITESLHDLFKQDEISD